MFKCSHLYLKCPFPLYLRAPKESAYMCTTHNSQQTYQHRSVTLSFTTLNRVFLFTLCDDKD